MWSIWRADRLSDELFAQALLGSLSLVVEYGSLDPHLSTLNSNPSSLNHTLPCWCPMLKPGNGIHDRFDGSILIGEYNCLNSLIHPKKVFDQLYERIRKSISRGNKVTLTVLDG